MDLYKGTITIQATVCVGCSFNTLTVSALITFLPVLQAIDVCLCFVKDCFPAGLCVGRQWELVSNLLGKTSLPNRLWFTSQLCSQRPLCHYQGCDFLMQTQPKNLSCFYSWASFCVFFVVLKFCLMDIYIYICIFFFFPSRCSLKWHPRKWYINFFWLFQNQTWDTGLHSISYAPPG